MKQLDDQIQGTCATLGCTNKQMSQGKSKYGYKRYNKLCSSCNKRKYGINPNSSYRRGYSHLKCTICSRCKFIGERCQFDVHHIDRNHSNNSVENLETLCANCHRLEHKDD